MTKPVILGLAQEVLSPKKWVSAAAAKILLGYTGSDRFYNALRKGEFRRKIETEGEGRDLVFYLYADLCAYADARKIEIGSYLKDWLEMIVWADTRTVMPTDEEIAANAKGKYSAKDMRSLLETRSYRGLPVLDKTSYSGGIIKPNRRGCPVGKQKGSRNSRSKLTEQDVREIRILFDSGKMTIKELAVRFNVHRSTINDIVNRNTWRHVK